MKKKLNIEEIRLLIPDYVSNSLSENEKKLVEEALSLSPELNEFYKEIKGTFEFVSSVKYQEPAPQYWNSLLTRIHQRIDEKDAKVYARNPFAVIWKVAVPVAAVVLIFIIYSIFTSPEPDITDRNKVVISDETKKDTITTQKKQPDEIQEIGSTAEQKKHRKTHRKKLKEDSRIITQEQNVAEQVQKPEHEAVQPEYVNAEELASMRYEDALILGAGEPGLYDEETDRELERLDTDQQVMFLEELIKSNL
jgi:hypothetical protein